MATIETTAFKDTLLHRLSNLEEEVGKLTRLMQEGREIVDKATQLPEVSGNGYPIEVRVGNALHLAKRLTAPETVARFDELLETAELIPDLLLTLKGISEDVISRIPPEGLHIDERLAAMVTLAGRLTDPVRMERLTRLLDLMDGAPDLFEAVNGAMQDMLAKAPAGSLRLDERVGAVLPLLDRLTTPEMTARLHDLLDLVETAPDLISAVSGMAGDLLARLPEKSLRLDERLEALLPLLDRLTTPEMLHQLNELAGLTELLPDLVQAASGVGRELASHLPPEGLRVDERLEAALPVLDKLTDPKVLAKMNLLLAIVEWMPEMELDPENEFLKKAADCEIDLGRILHLASATGSAFCQASKEEYAPMGLFGMMRAPLDKDRQVAIGFLMTFLKKLGQRLTR